MPSARPPVAPVIGERAMHPAVAIAASPAVRASRSVSVRAISSHIATSSAKEWGNDDTFRNLVRVAVIRSSVTRRERLDVEDRVRALAQLVERGVSGISWLPEK